MKYNFNEWKEPDLHREVKCMNVRVSARRDLTSPRNAAHASN